jgi:tripartite-type tricarboxylate transporter receptor subunit TctC
MKLSHRPLALGIIAFASVAFSSLSVADVADFYRGKQIRIVVGSDAGGGYDAYARTIAAHLGRFIPGNPAFVVQNMPGVGSLLAVNHVTNVAPKDGATIGAINPSAVTAPLFHPEQAKFDARRLNWLGTPVTIAYTIVAWHTAPVQTFEDLFATELLVASAGGASRTLPVLANGILGTRFKVILGYKSAGASMLAIERGEVQGNGGEALTNLKAVHANYLREKTLRIIGTYALRPNPELVGVPMVINFARTDEQRAALNLVLSSQDIGWPYVMASDVPADRVQAIRRAFDATMKDPDFLADAAKRKLDISPIRGEEQAALVDQTLATPKNVVELVKGIVGDH